MAKVKQKFDHLYDFEGSWWRCDITDLRFIESILKEHASSRIEYSNSDYSYSDIEDLLNSSGRKISEIFIRSEDPIGSVDIKLRKNGISFHFHPINHPAREDLYSYIKENLVIAKRRTANAVTIAGVIIPTALMIALVVRLTSGLEISFSNPLYWLISALMIAFPSVMPKIMNVAENIFLGLHMIEKGKVKSHWEMWGEKTFFLVVGAIISFVIQMIFRALK